MMASLWPSMPSMESISGIIPWGKPLTASPITYSVEGKQYVAIASATDVFAFGLYEPAAPVPLLRPANISAGIRLHAPCSSGH